MHPEELLAVPINTPKQGDKFVGAFSKFLNKILQSHDFKGEWQYGFVKPIKWRSHKKFKPLSIRGAVIACRAKPKGNASAWEIEIKPPKKYLLGDVFDVLIEERGEKHQKQVREIEADITKHEENIPTEEPMNNKKTTDWLRLDPFTKKSIKENGEAAKYGLIAFVLELDYMQAFHTPASASKAVAKNLELGNYVKHNSSYTIVSRAAAEVVKNLCRKNYIEKLLWNVKKEGNKPAIKGYVIAPEGIDEIERLFPLLPNDLKSRLMNAETLALALDKYNKKNRPEERDVPIDETVVEETLDIEALEPVIESPKQIASGTTRIQSGTTRIDSGITRSNPNETNLVSKIKDRIKELSPLSEEHGKLDEELITIDQEMINIKDNISELQSESLTEQNKIIRLQAEIDKISETIEALEQKVQSQKTELEEYEELYGETQARSAEIEERIRTILGTG